jgi:imidazolonepropionase-like amidohydrolase
VVQQTNMRGPYTFTITPEDGPTFWQDPLFLELSTPEQAEAMRERARVGPPPRTHEGQAPDVDARVLNALIYERIVNNHKRLYAEGVRIAMGTEGGAFSPHQTLQLLVEDVGLTPAQAIPIATRNSAEALRLTDLGTVATGKTASFMVLDANPLDDIKNTRRIADVYLYGHRVDRDMIKRTYLPGAARSAQE